MLIAHLVPGYFAAAASEASWSSGWSRGQRAVLWAAALGSTVTPDLDVVYNVLFRRFFNHSTLWTHSLWVYLGLGLVWLSLRLAKRWAYPATLIGLVTLGGLSHLVLDMVAHGTPIFYPVSMVRRFLPALGCLPGDVAYTPACCTALTTGLFGVNRSHRPGACEGKTR